MAVVTIPWGDGSGDNIYLTYPSASGDQTVEMSSDANTGSIDRTKSITFTASHHGTSSSKILTVTQEGVKEPYIVFADATVGQICATNWGDGTGIRPSQASQVTNSQFGTTFRNNTSITSFDELSYFKGLSQIPNNAFYGCSNLESVTIPENVTTLGQQAFRGCSKLATITLTNSITCTTNNTFNGCSVVSRVNVPSLAVWLGCTWAENGGPSFASSGIHLYINNTEVTAVTIPDSVTAVKTTAFRRCIGITSVMFHNQVTSIGSYAFQYCSALTSMDVSASVATIEGSCFQNAASSSSKATYIFRATSPPTLGTYAFTNNNVNAIYVPYGTSATYKAATNWSSWKAKIVELDQNGNIPT